MSTLRKPWDEPAAQAKLLPDGLAKLALAEEAVRLADMHGDIVAGFKLRRDVLLHACFGAGRPDKVLVVFAWLLARCDAEPAQFSAVLLCQEYFRDLLRVLRDAVDIPREQVEAVMLDGLERLREPFVLTWRVYEFAATTAGRFGDQTRAADYWQRRDRARPRLTHDWAFASQASEVEYHLIRGDESAALTAAETLFRWVRQGRGHRWFSWISSHLLSPLHRAGRSEEARHWQRVGYGEVQNQLSQLGEVGRHVEFLAAVGDLDHAVKVFEQHIGGMLLSTEAIDRFHFHQAGWLLLRRLRSRGETARLRLPGEMPYHRPDGVYEVDALAEQFGGIARGVAERYDARAGNDCFSRTLLEPALRLEREQPLTGA